MPNGTNGGDIFIAFGADTGGLEAALALAKANVQATTNELNKLGRGLRKAGEEDAAALVTKMREVGQTLTVNKGQFAEISTELARVGSTGALASSTGLSAVAAAVKDAGQEMEHAGAAGAHGGAGVGFFLREFHALADELSSGRYRNAESTFLNLSTTFLMAHASIVPMVAAAAALGFFAYEAISANNAMHALELDAAIAQMKMTDDQASQLASVIGYLANVSKSSAADIAKPFIALSPGGDLVAAMTSQYLPKHA